MKKLVLIAACLLTAGAASAKANQLSLPVKRALAREICLMMAYAQMTISVNTPPLSYQLHQRDQEKLLQVANSIRINALAENEDILELYLQIREGEEQPDQSKVSRLVNKFRNNTAKAMNSFIKNPTIEGKRVVDGKLSWQWEGENNSTVIENANRVVINFNMKRRLSGKSSLQELLHRLAVSKGDKLVEYAVDYLELLNNHPSFNINLHPQDVDKLFESNKGDNYSFEEFHSELFGVIYSKVRRELSLNTLLTDHGLDKEFIEQELVEIDHHLTEKQIVIINLTGESKQDVLTIFAEGNNQDLKVLEKLRQMERQHDTRYVALWRQDDGISLEYIEVEIDSNNVVTITDKQSISHQDISDHEEIDLALFQDSSNILTRTFGHSVSGVSYADLENPRTIFDVTGEFLLAMGWSWYKFGRTIYPDDEDKATKFIVNYDTSLLQNYLSKYKFFTSDDLPNDAYLPDALESIRTRLTAEQAAMSSSEKITAIDTFLNDLDHYIAKHAVPVPSPLSNFRVTNLNEKQQQLFTRANINYQRSFGRWSNPGDLFSGNSLDFLPGGVVIIFPRIAYLISLGMTEAEIREKIFTEKVFNQLSKGEIVTEKDLNGMRQLLDLQSVQAVVNNLDGVKDKEDLVTTIMSLPSAVMYEGFARKVANGLHSYTHMRKALSNIEEKSMFKALVKPMLNLPKELEDIRYSLTNVLELAEQSRRDYFRDHKAHIIYFVSPLEDGKPMSLVKVGQVNYNEKYINDGKVDIEKLHNHNRFKQLFPMSIEYEIIYATSLPALNDSKMRKIVLELFDNKGVREATIEDLKGIVTRDGSSEYFVMEGDVKSVAQQAEAEAERRFEEHGYVPVATTPRTNTPPSSKDTQVNHDSTPDTGFMLRELPVELEVKQKPKRKKRVKGNKIRGKTAPRAPPQKSAEEQAREELNDKIIQLSNAIGRGEDLPTDTPIWLHLRALVRYMQTTPEVLTPKALAERADIRHWQQRFLAVITPETTTLPNQDELEAIELALTKYVNKSKISAKHKQQMLNNLQREIESIQQKLEKERIAQALPKVTEQPSVPKAADSPKTEVADAMPKVEELPQPQQGTAKKITADDVEAFLQEELRPTYQLFSELMLVLDINTPQELTDELNKTLIAVNAKLALQQEATIQLLSIPLLTHLVGYEHGNSDFIDRTLWKLQIIADNNEHPHKAEIARLINNIIRAAKIQRFESIEQLNKALENNDADLRVTAEQFAKIQELINTARAEWQEDWQSN